MKYEKELKTPMELVLLEAYSEQDMSYKIGVFLTENPEAEMFDADPVEKDGFWTCWMMRPNDGPIPEWAKPTLKEKWSKKSESRSRRLRD